MEAVDIVLVSPGGREKVYQNLGTELTAIEPPLWCRLIGGYLLDRDISIEILDTEALAWGEQRVADYISEKKPRLVGIVVFGHQPSASTQMMVSAECLSRAIRHTAPWQKQIIVGGHVSALPEQTLAELPVDYVCIGEGPITFYECVRFLRGELSNLEQVPGLLWKQNGLVQRTQRAPLINDLTSDLHGNVWHLLPMEKYRAHNWQCFGELERRQPYASIYTTLGCPYKCIFCCINAPFDANKYRCREPAAVVEEIEFLYKHYNVRTFKIIDEMFVLKDKHYLRICELLAEKSFASELNIWAYARVDTVKKDTLKIMRRAGIRWLALGIESGSAMVRDGAEKSFGQNEIEEIVREIQEENISVIGNFIFGLPDDTYESMQETLDMAKKLKCEFVNFYSAMAYPGSRLYALAIQNNWLLPQAWSGYSQHSYDCQPLPTNHLSAAEVLEFRDKAFHEYFDHEPYLNYVGEKFGVETRQHIVEMAKIRLGRKLIDKKEAL